MRCAERKWMAFFASCIVCSSDFAIILTFGSFFVPLLDRFGETRTTTATVQSVLLGTGLTSGVFSGMVIKRFGTTRVSLIGSALLSGSFIAAFFAKTVLVLNVLIGIVGGIGVSFLFISSTVVASNCFQGTAQNIALSVHNVFIGIGAIVYPYVINKVLDKYTVNETFLILGGIFLNNFAISLLMRSNERLNCKLPKSKIFPLDKNEGTTEINVSINNQSKGHVRNSSIFKRVRQQIVPLMNLRFVLVLIGTGLVIPSNNGYLIVFYDLCAWKGFTSDQSLGMFISFHAFSTFGRALPVILFKFRPDTDIMLLLACYAVSGCIGQLCILFSTNISLAFAGNILSGLAFGGVICAATIAVAQLAPTDLFGVAFGLMFTINGIATVSIGPLYGYIRDSADAYEVAIIITATLNGAGVILYAAAKIYGTYVTRDKHSSRVSSITDIRVPDNVRF